MTGKIPRLALLSLVVGLFLASAGRVGATVTYLSSDGDGYTITHVTTSSGAYTPALQLYQGNLISTINIGDPLYWSLPVASTTGCPNYAQNTLVLEDASRTVTMRLVDNSAMSFPASGTISSTVFFASSTPMALEFGCGDNNALGGEGITMEGTSGGSYLGFIPGTNIVPYTAPARFYLSSSLTTTTPASFQFATPTSGYSGPDFPAWVLSYANQSSSYAFYRIWVNWGTVPGIIIHSDPGSIGSFSGSGTSTITKGTSFVGIGASTTIYAHATVSGEVSADLLITLATASTSFNIVTNTGVVTVEACTPPGGGFFDDPGGWILYDFCYGFTHLFLPTPDQQVSLSDDFSGLKDTYAQKPPFGYLSSITTAMSLFSVASSTTSTPIMDATSSAALAPFTTKMDGGITLLLWLLFIAWLFHRARLFEL